MSDKQVRAQYTQEFKLEAVRQVRGGQAISVVVKVLSIPKASLGNWVRLSATGEWVGTGSGDDKAIKVTPEQMEIARLRAENVRLRMERDIAKKPRRTSRRTRCEVRLDSPNEKTVSGEHRLRGAGGQCKRVGGFNRSSQHLNHGGVYGTTCEVDAEVDGTRSNALARCAVASV